MEDYELMDAYLTNIKHTLEHADELRHQMKKELINQQYIGNESNIKQKDLDYLFQLMETFRNNNDKTIKELPWQ